MSIVALNKAIAILTALTLLTLSCRKNGESMAIAGIAPDTGKHSSIVTITGSGFSTNPAENKVTFNGRQAVVQNASATLIHAFVPKGAGTGPVKVERGGRLAAGPDFHYVYTATVSTLAGGGTSGFADGEIGTAKFSNPADVAVDGQGNIYVADHGNFRVRKITPAGTVTTLAGRSTYGFTDGPGSVAQFFTPAGLAVDGTGTVYVADIFNNCIRKITPAGVVSTLAGNTTPGFTDGEGSAARFYKPGNLALDARGNVYVSDHENNSIRKISPGGVVSTLAGNGTERPGFADGTGSAARFNNPSGIAVDGQGTVYVADLGNHRIRKISPSGNVSTLAGSGVPGFADGAGSTARFFHPAGLAIDAKGNVYVADNFNHRIRKITPGGLVTTVAGGSDQFYQPTGIALDLLGNIYTTEFWKSRIARTILE
ncbi:IPT/TIG domain-containing protein [Paraflavisolibacter sp. H34]|uniref:IPT/TIG domain-containing protein n=1 Tax=Huijunlia imazamoxiresistens TaxID=3127457 RepID=UPI0030185294